MAEPTEELRARIRRVVERELVKYDFPHVMEGPVTDVVFAAIVAHPGNVLVSRVVDDVLRALPTPQASIRRNYSQQGPSELGFRRHQP